MRGAISGALVIGLAPHIRFRGALIDAVYGVVFITLVVQGLSIGPLITRMRLAR